jgi:hypothetical protein
MAVILGLEKIPCFVLMYVSEVFVVGLEQEQEPLVLRLS